VKMGDEADGHDRMDSGMRSLMDDLGLSMDMLLESSIFVSPPEFFLGSGFLSVAVEPFCYLASKV
jgi:hypothetical protein